MKVRRYREGRGEHAREVEVTEFKLWNKGKALEKLGEHLGLAAGISSTATCIRCISCMTTKLSRASTIWP